MNNDLPSSKRFSNRVDNYVKYRPSYPPEIFPYLENHLGLLPGMEVADIGSGTGILSRLFLDFDCRVYAVEPNSEMRTAAENMLSASPQFTSINAAAEATTLPDNSIDMIAVGQAYHWFDRKLAKPEFHRILKPGGSIVLLWNIRDQSDPFIQAFEALTKKFALDYKKATHTRIDKNKELADFFTPGDFNHTLFNYQQVFDYQGLSGRLSSSSYAPLPGHPNHGPMLAALKELFTAYQTNGKVTFPYITNLYWTRLNK